MNHVSGGASGRKDNFDPTDRRRRASKMNEFRGRFISALRQYKLTGTELRLAIAVNDLYDPEKGKAWPSQAYLSEALADVATGRKMPIRCIHRAGKGLKKKGIVEIRKVRLSYNLSRLEYRPVYDKIIGRDAGYPKRRQRDSVEGIQRLILEVPDKNGIATGQTSHSYWPAPGSEDTELGVLMELEVGHGETEDGGKSY
jgi:hypothetical protein